MIEELEAHGQWLFRWRSYLPLALFAAAFAMLGQFHYPWNDHFLDELWEVFCLLIGFVGLGIRGLTVGFVPQNTSGRNTRRQVADTLNTTGMYSIVRNPLYLGNFFVGLAVVLYFRWWWFTLIYLLAFLAYYERIIFAEEAFLREKFGAEYMSWASRTPAFWPRPWLWRPPEMTFSFRTVIRREYQSAFGLIMALFAAEELTEWYMGHGWHIDAMWLAIVAAGAVAYLVIRFLHKCTSVLHVEGR
jgi:protein-S-isoprenylcysteine O-methyltransferase Ste14